MDQRGAEAWRGGRGTEWGVVQLKPVECMSFLLLLSSDVVLLYDMLIYNYDVYRPTRWLMFKCNFPLSFNDLCMWDVFVDVNGFSAK